MRVRAPSSRTSCGDLSPPEDAGNSPGPIARSTRPELVNGRRGTERRGAQRLSVATTRQPLLEVLPGVRDRVDRPASLDSLLPADQRADVDDALALLARDAGPVVGVGGVGQVLILLELVDACREQVRDAQSLLVDLEIVLDGHLLGPVDDVLDHRPRVEVLEVQDLLVTVGIGDLEEPVLLDLGVHPLDGALDHGVYGARARPTVLREVVGMQRQLDCDVLREDVAGSLGVWALNLDLHVQPPWAEDRRIDHVFTVGRANDDNVLQTLDAIDLAQQLRHDRVLHVRRHARPARAEQRVHLVEAHDHRCAFAGLLAGALQYQPNVPLSLADVLVEQLRALDVEEVGLALALPGGLRHLLGQRVRDRLGDQRLTAAGWTVEEYALWWPELVFTEEIRMEVGELDRVPDLLDLSCESADRLVVDVGHFLQDQLFDLGLWNTFVDVARARLEEQRVASAQRRVSKRFRDPGDPLIVGVADDQSAFAIGEHLLEHDDLADLLPPHRFDDVERLVEHDLLAAPKLVHLDVGAHRDTQLPAAGEDVDSAVLTCLKEDPESSRRLGQPVDLLLQRDDLVARLLERRDQPFVLCRDS